MRVPRYGHIQMNKSFGVGSTIKDYDPNSWGLDKRLLPLMSEFSENEELTSWQLDRFADRLLWDDIEEGNDHCQEPYILMYEHLKERRKREIYVTSGKPDKVLMASLSADEQFMYWRTHPKGRSVNSKEQREKNGAGWYR